MKGIYLVFLVLILPMIGWAQATQGVVVYERKVNMHAKLGPEQEEMKQFLPEFQTSKHQLFFSTTESVYKAMTEENEDLEIEASPEEGVQMKIKMQAPQNIMYRNFAENKTVEVRDFMGKKYLLEEESTPRAWKIAAEQKDILGYACQKAIFEDVEKEQQIVAWFAPALACPSGPEGFAHLPGLILEVSINDGEEIYELNKLELKDLETGIIAAPSEGKSMSREKFEKLQEERLREMGAQGGKGGVRVIIKH